MKRELQFTSLGAAVLAVLLASCIRNEPVQTAPSDPAVVIPQESPAPVPKPAAEPLLVSEPELEEGSGETAWAKGFEGQLILGLDGALYEPYTGATIELVQTALHERGLYFGPVNGILDPPTMKAIYAFQKAQGSLQLCGIPTSRTRQIFVQGSHTDPV